MFFKEKRIRDKKHLAFVRTLPCIMCSMTGRIPFSLRHADSIEFESEPAHIRLQSNSGTALKPSDDRVAPLCWLHHRAEHRGAKTFWDDKLDNAISLAKALYEVSGDRAKAIELIKGADL